MREVSFGGLLTAYGRGSAEAALPSSVLASFECMVISSPPAAQLCCSSARIHLWRRAAAALKVMCSVPDYAMRIFQVKIQVSALVVKPVCRNAESFGVVLVKLRRSIFKRHPQL